MAPCVLLYILNVNTGGENGSFLRLKLELNARWDEVGMGASFVDESDFGTTGSHFCTTQLAKDETYVRRRRRREGAGEKEQNRRMSR